MRSIPRDEVPVVIAKSGKETEALAITCARSRSPVGPRRWCSLCLGEARSACQQKGGRFVVQCVGF